LSDKHNNINYQECVKPVSQWGNRADKILPSPFEKNARTAGMFAQQAEPDVQMAELQVKLAEADVDIECSEGY